MTTTGDLNNQRSNQFGALINDSDSEGSEITSATQRRLIVYQQNVTADLQQLQILVQQIEDTWSAIEEEDDNNYD